MANELWEINPCIAWSFGRNPKSGGTPANDRSMNEIIILYVGGMEVVFGCDFIFCGSKIEIIAETIKRYIRK